MSNQKIHIVFATADSQKNTSFDEDEVAEVHWLIEEKARELIKNGEINDGLSLTALLLHLVN